MPAEESIFPVDGCRLGLTSPIPAFASFVSLLSAPTPPLLLTAAPPAPAELSLPADFADLPSLPCFSSKPRAARVPVRPLPLCLLQRIQNEPAWLPTCTPCRSAMQKKTNEQINEEYTHIRNNNVHATVQTKTQGDWTRKQL